MIKPALVKYSLENIYKRRRRSWLTILSVLIGIASITALISFGYGISFYVSSLSNKMGNDKLIVMAKGVSPMGSSVKFDKSDVDAIERVNGVAEVMGIYTISAEVEYGKEKRYAYALGGEFKEHRALLEELMTVEIIVGDALSSNEKSKAVLGYNYQFADKIFSKAIKLGDKIKVNGNYLTVSGFYGAVGSPDDDSHIYITETAAKEVFGATSYAEIFVRVSPGENATKIAEDVTKELRTHRNQKKGAEDFFAQTFEQVIATFNIILNVIISVVLLIAVISIIVASVNIMNTMYASILERTKEIGIFKAIGARNSEILWIFMTESGILSLLGGIIGVILGFIIAKVAGSIIASAGYGFFAPYFSWQMVASILLFSFAVGLIAGFLPAYRASKLSPVEALRYE
jgi:putative ABC transport system permease protein